MIGVMKAVEVISASGAALAALDPIRARLLAELRVPASATELAPRVGLSRQRVNYHLRKLEDQGLVVAAETRQWGGLTERRLVASAAGYVLSPGALGAAAAEPGSTPDRASVSYLLSLAGRLIREVGGMLAGAGAGSSAGPGAAPARVPVLALDVDVKFGSPADRAAFADELTTCVIALVARYHDQNASQGRWHRVLVGVHPVPADVSVGPPTDPVPAFEQPAEEKP
jgi:DNA-binding transcriptional ArsR family regulator